MRVQWVLVLFIASVVNATEIKGKITNAAGGEPLGQVQISLLDTRLSTTTSLDGTFLLKEVRPGKYILRVSAVGYRLITLPISLSQSSDAKEFDINLAPDNFQRTDTVEVRGDVFQGGDSPAVNEINLTSSEIKEASTVLADDPFRAIQSLPGVSAAGNNELFAQFSVMGAAFTNVGIYIDDVLIPAPLHTLPTVENGASLSLLTSETVEEMKLLPAAYPEKFGDETGAALDIRTREGSRTPPMFRASSGLADSELLGEGDLGDSKRGSWLASARKSYIGWLVRNRLGGDFSDISFYDGDMKLSYDIAPGQNLNLYALAGHTNVEVAHPEIPTDLDHGASDFYLARAGWRWTISPALMLDNRAAYIRQPVAEVDAAGNETHNSYQEWSGGSNLIWSWTKNNLLEAGWTLRRLSGSFPQAGLSSTGVVFSMERPSAVKSDGYLQQSASFFNNRVHLLGSIRFDSVTGYPPHPFSPQGSAAVQIAHATQLQFGYGHYIQYEFPPFDAPPSGCAPSVQSWETANHFTASIEQRLGENSRFRVQAFDRESAELQHAGPTACPGIALFNAGTQTFGHTHSRGFQFTAQRRSANRLSGWIGYTLVYARENQLFRNPITKFFAFSPDFSSFEDQRNSLNVFATYRFKPSIIFSGKVLYGSGFPISGGLQRGPGGTPVTAPVIRFGPYLRADFRVDKSWAFTRWKMTLYGEVLNFTNHPNRIVTSQEFLPNGGLLTTTAEALPVTPTAGLAFEF